MKKSPRRIWRPELGWALLLGLPVLLGIWWIPNRGSSAGDSYSVTASGKKAYYKLLGRYFDDVARQTQQLVPDSATDTLIVPGPLRNPDLQQMEELYDWIYHDGGTLVFAARWDSPAVDLSTFDIEVRPLETSTDDDEPEEKTAEDIGRSEVEQAEADLTAEAEIATGPESQPDNENEQSDGPTFGFQTVNAQTSLVDGDVQWRTRGHVVCHADHEVLVSTDDGSQVLAREIGNGIIVVSASDYPFTNQAFIDSHTAPLALRLIQYGFGDGGVRVDESLNKQGTPQVFGILFSPTFRPMTLQLVLLCVVFGWMGSRRFGAPLPPAEEPRRSIREHANALGLLHYVVGGGSSLLRNYFDYFRSEVRHIYTADSRSTDARILAQRAGMDEAEVRDLLSEISRASADGNSVPTGTAAGLIRRLAELHDKVHGGRRPSRE